MEPLGALTRLNRDWLHVFVAGPGQGEGIAVALPERGWMLVDGCSTADRRFPLEAILQQWRMTDDDPVEAMVLTHPHEDHVEGVAELIEALSPKQVAVTTGSTPGSTLLQVVQALIRNSTDGSTRTGLLQVGCGDWWMAGSCCRARWCRFMRALRTRQGSTASFCPKTWGGGCALQPTISASCWRFALAPCGWCSQETCPIWRGEGAPRFPRVGRPWRVGTLIW